MNRNLSWTLLISLWIICCLFVCTNAYYIKTLKNKPPPAKHGFDLNLVQQDEIDAEIDAWDPEDGTNIWEHSGLFEGDIMLYQKTASIKNGLIEESAKWPHAIIPYYIDDSFSEEETLSILNAMQEYHNKTCVRFRPFVPTDENWIDIKQDYSGCWSSVGMKSQGQVVNLGSQKCRRHGVIIHELLHAVGFYHQQSASDRDDYIIIYWENIRRGREHNFNKYDDSKVTNYGISYDYESVMHYSAKAFSKNGNHTIEPIYESFNLGQRQGLSEKDILKINSMYAANCNNSTVNTVEIHQQMQLIQQEVPPNTNSGSDNILTTIIRWLESIFGIDLRKHFFFFNYLSK